MKVDKKSALIILSVIVVVLLLAAAGVLLVMGIMQFNESEAKLSIAKKALKELYEKKPFPSHQNVSQEKANVNLLNEWFLKLTESLRKGQIEPVQKSPSTFMSLLQAKKPELISKANASGKVVSETFGFGFERYFMGTGMPEPTDVPRLTQQFLIVEKLCDALFSEKLDAISGIIREEFEAGAETGIVPAGPARVARAGAAGAGTHGPAGPATVKLFNKSAGLMGDEDLYAKFHFILEFRAKEKVLWNVLNKLSSNEMFVVVTGVQAFKDGSDMADIKARSAFSSVVPGEGKEKTAESRDKSGVRGQQPVLVKSAKPAADPAAAAVVEKPEPEKVDTRQREERIVCGPEMEKPMNVKIEIDVYRFRGE